MAVALSADIHSPIGLIAGSGMLPIKFAERAKAAGLQVVTIAHEGETDPEIAKLSSTCTWIKVGQLGRLIKTLKTSGVHQVAFAGGISRIRLFRGVRLDLRGIKVFARVGSLRDDMLLRGIANEIEGEGIQVISAGMLLTEYIPGTGTLTSRNLSPAEAQDGMLGFRAAKLLGSLDVGQTVVVRAGLVLALEAIEGTDATIKRAGELSVLANRKGFKILSRSGTQLFKSGAVVVKISKPQQDQRLDLPTIGASTLEAMQSAGATALVLESGKSIMLDPAAVVQMANQAGIAIQVVESEEDLQKNT